MGNSSSIKERLSAGEISGLSEDTGFSVGQLASLYTRSAPTKNWDADISQLLRDSFSVSQQPPIWEPPSHYSMSRRENFVDLRF